MKNHNIFYRELAEIKSAFASAITPENAIILCRSLQRDCLHSKDRDKDQAWERLLDILGLKSVSPDLVKADEVKVYRANPPSLVERAMRQERTATSSSIIESKTPVV
jgi:hypothetical protein